MAYLVAKGTLLQKGPFCNKKKCKKKPFGCLKDPVVPKRHTMGSKMIPIIVGQLVQICQCQFGSVQIQKGTLLYFLRPKYILKSEFWPKVLKNISFVILKYLYVSMTNLTPSMAFQTSYMVAGAQCKSYSRGFSTPQNRSPNLCGTRNTCFFHK